MLHGNCDAEIVCSDPDLLETRSTSFVPTSQSGISSIIATVSSIGGRYFCPFGATI